MFPVLTKAHAKTLSESDEAVARMRAMLTRISSFYGLGLSEAIPASVEVAAEGVLRGGFEGALPATPQEAGAVVPASAASAAATRSGVGGTTANGAVNVGSAAAAVLAEGSGSAAAAANVPPAAPAAHLSGAEDCAAEAPAPFDAHRVALWAHNGDHNLLRITRIIRSLRLFGLEAESRMFYRAARAVGEARGLSGTTLQFWQRASEEPPFAPLRSRSVFGSWGGDQGGRNGDDGGGSSDGEGGGMGGKGAACGGTTSPTGRATRSGKPF